MSRMIQKVRRLSSATEKDEWGDPIEIEAAFDYEVELLSGTSLAGSIDFDAANDGFILLIETSNTARRHFIPIEAIADLTVIEKRQ